MGLPKHRRLRQRQEFRHVLRTGRRARDGLVAVAAARRQSSDQPTRFGFSVSRRVGGAVTRNRVKRRLREIAREAPVAGGWDVVVTAFAPAARSDASELGASIAKLSERIGVAEAGAGDVHDAEALGGEGDVIGRDGSDRRSGGRRRRRVGVSGDAGAGADADADPKEGERRG